MSKAHRGKGIRDQFAHGRGECPVCKRKSVKVLYETEAGEQKFKICKTCKAAVKSGKKSLPTVDVVEDKTTSTPTEPVVKESAPETVAKEEVAATEEAPVAE